MGQQQQQLLPAKNRVQDNRHAQQQQQLGIASNKGSNVHGKIGSRVVWAMACLSLHELDWSWCKSAVGICEARSGLAELRDPNQKSC